MLELESPKHITSDIILMPPKSTIHLKANVNDAVYQLDTSSVGIVKVTKDGTIRTSNTIGRDLIIVCFLFKIFKILI